MTDTTEARQLLERAEYSGEVCDQCKTLARQVLDLAGKLEAAQALLAREASGEVTIHACPPRGEALTPCCQHTPFELPRYDRISATADKVNCDRARLFEERDALRSDAEQHGRNMMHLAKQRNEALEERDTLRTKLNEANGQIAKLICDHASEMEAAKSTIAQQKRIIETARVMEDAAAVIGRELEATRQEREALRAQVADLTDCRKPGTLAEPGCGQCIACLRGAFEDARDQAEERRTKAKEADALRARVAEQALEIERLRVLSPIESALSAEVQAVRQERDAARRDATAAQNRLNVAEASLRMRGQEIEQLRADKERLITQADSLTNNLVRARELIEAESARLAECEQVVEEVRDMQDARKTNAENAGEHLLLSADYMAAIKRVAFMALPAKRTP